MRESIGPAGRWKHGPPVGILTGLKKTGHFAASGSLIFNWFSAHSKRMNRTFADGEAGFLEGFGHRRVGVDRAAQVFGATAVFHVGDRRSDHLARAVADDLHAENLVCLGVGNDLAEAVGAVDCDGAAIGGEGELAHVDVQLVGLGLVFTDAHAGDFRLGVDHARDDVVVHVAALAGDQLDAGHGFFLGLVGEHRARNDVANCVNALGGGAEMVVDLHAAALVELHARLVGSEARGGGLATHGDEDLVGFKLELLVLLFGGEERLLAFLGDTGDFRAELETEALLFKETLGQLGDVLIDGARDLRQQLDDGYLRTKARPNATQLQADGARADDDKLLRHLVKAQGFGAGNNRVAVKLHERQLHRHGAGCNNDVCGGDDLFAVVASDLYLALAFKRAEAAQHVYLARLGELGDAAIELGDDLVLALEHGGDVASQLADLDAVHIAALLDGVENLGGMQQRLRRDAAHVEARAAERGVFLDECGFKAKLRGAKRGYVAAGAGANDEEVVICHGKINLGFSQRHGGTEASAASFY